MCWDREEWWKGYVVVVLFFCEDKGMGFRVYVEGLV